MKRFFKPNNFPESLLSFLISRYLFSVLFNELIMKTMRAFSSAQVENRTGLDLVCRFDHGKARQEEVIEAWETNAFLIRYIDQISLKS